MSNDTELGGIVPLNVIPNELNATTLKLWQRLASAAAVMETFERQRCGLIPME